MRSCGRAVIGSISPVVRRTRQMTKLRARGVPKWSPGRHSVRRAHQMTSGKPWTCSRTPPGRCLPRRTRTGRTGKPRSPADGGQDLRLGHEQLPEAGRREVHESLHRLAVERLALGRALDLDEGARIGADDVEVDVSPGVLAVVEI